MHKLIKGRCLYLCLINIQYLHTLMTLSLMYISKNHKNQYILISCISSIQYQKLILFTVIMNSDYIYILCNCKLLRVCIAIVHTILC